MARPKLTPQDKHSEQLNIPLKPADLARLRHNAARAETTVTDFVRASALGHRFEIIDTNTPDFATVEQIRRIGVNLNQLVKAMNEGRIPPSSSVESTCRMVQQLLAEWIANDRTSDHRQKL